MEYQKSCIGLDSRTMPKWPTWGRDAKIYFDSNPEMLKMIPTLSENAQKYLKPRSNFSKIILKSCFATILWHHIFTQKKLYYLKRESINHTN
jgi:hypothetical protein